MKTVHFNPLILCLLLLTVGRIFASEGADSISVPPQEQPEIKKINAEEQKVLPDETSFFRAAVISFNDGIFDRAARDFSQFRELFPNSTNYTKTIEYQARSLFMQKKYKETTEFLKLFLTNEENLQSMQPIFRYWSGLSFVEMKDYPNAISNFSEIIQKYPSNELLPSVLFYTGVAWQKMDSSTQIFELYNPADGVFRKLAAEHPTNAYILQCWLLLLQTQISQKQYEEAKETSKQLGNKELSTEIQWKYLYWISRLGLDTNDLKSAEKHVAELLTLTTKTGLLNFEYQALSLQGDLLRKENKHEEAIAIYEKNLANKQISLQDRWQALINTVKIKQELKQTESAIGLLENFKQENGGVPYNSAHLMMLADLQLQTYFKDRPQLRIIPPGGGLGNTNLILAKQNYETFLELFKDSELVSKSMLNLGLCEWELNEVDSAKSRFLSAVEKLKDYKDGALARVKLAETYFYKKEYDDAAEVINQYMELYANASEIPDYLQEQALHIQLSTAIESKNSELAKACVAAALSKYPKSEFTERDLIHLGNFLCNIGKPVEGREQFEECLKRFPESKIQTEITFALIRTWLYERNYKEAIKKYQAWIEENKTSHVTWQAHFELAWCYSQISEKRMALQLFTDYLEKYPNTPNAILARKWIADYYFNIGEFPTAERHYQLLFQSADPDHPDLLWESRLLAARSAYQRGAYKDAEDYLKTMANLLINDEKDGNYLDQALLLLGDTISEKTLSSTVGSDKTSLFAEAINAYSRVNEKTPLGAIALTRIANCHFQLAALSIGDTNRIPLAIQYYNKAITSPYASVKTRSMAEIGLAKLYQTQASFAGDNAQKCNQNLELALDHYLNVFQNKIAQNTDSAESGEFDLFSVQRAGLEAAMIFETQGKTNEALNIYKRLRQMVPSLQPVIDKKIQALKK